MIPSIGSAGGPLILLPVEGGKEWKGIDPIPAAESKALFAALSAKEKRRLFAEVEVGERPTNHYDIACSTLHLCAPIHVRKQDLYVFGDTPDLLYYLPRPDGALFFKWTAADTLEELIAFAESLERQGKHKYRRTLRLKERQHRILEQRPTSSTPTSRSTS